MTGFVLHLLRHGEPEGAGALIGHTDAAPTTAGIAACVAQAQGVKAQMLIASDLSRARLVGEEIGAASGTALVIDPRWRELDFGAWDGLAPADIDNAALMRFWDDPDAHAPPDGECWSALVHRVAAAIGDLAPHPTLIVTHAGAMRAALAVLCRFDARQAWALDLPYACLLSLRVWPGANPVGQVTGLRP